MLQGSYILDLYIIGFFCGQRFLIACISFLLDYMWLEWSRDGISGEIKLMAATGLHMGWKLDG
jgi:hypothetical protein